METQPEKQANGEDREDGPDTENRPDDADSEQAYPPDMGEDEGKDDSKET